MYSNQAAYRIRLGWGRAGLEYLAKAEATVIIDVLSFTTSVDIAISRGAVVHPYAWRDNRAERFAFEQGASLARARGERGFSLSPASLVDIESGTKLVLPSPNGSSLSALAAGSSHVIAACLRNASAVASYCDQFESLALIPAGERWEDGSLRPALEDLLGAGAVIAALQGELITSLSPEAETAKHTFTLFQDRLQETLMACASGLELSDRGYSRDVILAAAHDSSTAVPLLKNGQYKNWRHDQSGH